MIELKPECVIAVLENTGRINKEDRNLVERNYKDPNKTQFHIQLSNPRAIIPVVMSTINGKPCFKMSNVKLASLSRFNNISLEDCILVA